MSAPRQMHVFHPADDSNSVLGTLELNHRGWVLLKPMSRGFAAAQRDSSDALRKDPDNAIRTRVFAAAGHWARHNQRRVEDVLCKSAKGTTFHPILMYDLVRPKVSGERFGIAPFRTESDPDPNTGVLAQVPTWCNDARVSERKGGGGDQSASPGTNDESPKVESPSRRLRRLPQIARADLVPNFVSDPDADPVADPVKDPVSDPVAHDVVISVADLERLPLTEYETALLAEEAHDDGTFDPIALCSRLDIELADAVMFGPVRRAIDVANAEETVDGFGHSFNKSPRYVAEAFVVFGRKPVFEPEVPLSASKREAVDGHAVVDEDVNENNSFVESRIGGTLDIESAERSVRLLGAAQKQLAGLMQSLSALQDEILSKI